MSDYHLRSSLLRYNSLIRVENRPVFYKDRFLKGITKEEQLMENFFRLLPSKLYTT